MESEEEHAGRRARTPRHRGFTHREGRRGGSPPHHPGDYVIADLGIERKTVADFFSSLVRKRLFEHLGRLREYPIPLLILERDLSEISRQRNPSSVWSALLSIMLDLSVHVVPTSSRKQTAKFLENCSRRERRTSSLRFKPKNLSLCERQMFVVQGLPDIGEKLSREMLGLFGFIRAVFLAGEKEMRRIDGIGEKRAREIRELLDAPFEEAQGRLK